MKAKRELDNIERELHLNKGQENDDIRVQLVEDDDADQKLIYHYRDDGGILHECSRDEFIDRGGIIIEVRPKEVKDED